MTVGSLFSGIGGFDLAAERVFGKGCIKFQVEIDPWCQRVLAKHWPNVPRFSDIRIVTGEDLEPVDLVCGGFPCQPFSLAGKRLGSEDERALWPEMCRVVSLTKPTWVVGENVPGLISMGLDQVCADLEALGYEVWTLGIPAVALGAPHIRQRLWIIAYADRQRCKERDLSRVAGDTGQPDGDAGAAVVAHSDRQREQQPEGLECKLRRRTGNGDQEHLMAHTGGRRNRIECQGIVGAPERVEARHVHLGWDQPSVCGVAPGVPGRVDRLRGLGNAIVPQVAEFLFRRIQEVA